MISGHSVVQPASTGFFKIDSLQKEFKDEVQFIAVNAESPELTRKFIKITRTWGFLIFRSCQAIQSGIFFPRSLFSMARLGRFCPYGQVYNRCAIMRQGAVYAHFCKVKRTINQLNFDPSYLRRGNVVGRHRPHKKIRSSLLPQTACIPEFDIGNFYRRYGQRNFYVVAELNIRF